MFTGLVEQVGLAGHLVRRGDDAELTVGASFDDYDLGESIAVNGVCLTVTRFDRSGFSADVSRETLQRSNLGRLKPGSRVNLERACRLGDRLGGHIVSGHIDATAPVRSLTPIGNALKCVLSAPKEVARFLAEKGSVALDGISLTINSVVDQDDGVGFSVMLVPHSQSSTTIDGWKVGVSLNLEVDLFARYVARQLAMGRPDDDSRMLGVLGRAGFL